jgi:hypothetical protein
MTAMLVLCTTVLFAQQSRIQYFRPWDKEGINVFEPSKTAEQPEYTGFKIRIGGSFTQTFQSLTHSNKPAYARLTATNATNKNFLYGVSAKDDSTSATLQGFNLAMANLNLDMQIADGIRVGLENYMSSRHHSEFWVKGGYIQIDKLPMFGSPDWYTKYLRVKIGHFQPNFGDMQFRRTDGGNTMFNPFVENYILDAFTTEIGGEVYLFPADGFMAMIGLNGGLINGNVENYPSTPVGTNVEPTKRNPSIYFKAAYDKQMNDLRFRLSASVYNNGSTVRNTLYAGDRTGSQYFMAMEPAATASGASSYSANFTSGRFNPGLTNQITTFMINPFVKYKGLELFGSYESATGRTYAEREGDKRTFNQYSVEGLYRFLKDENMYIGARYVGMSGRPLGFTNDVSISRTAVAAGWFPTPNLLLKGEYVLQNFSDFNDYRADGKFNGFAIQAVVGF